MKNEEILKKSFRTIKKRSLKESLAKLEEELFEAEKLGNKRQQDAIKKIMRRLKSVSAKR